MKSWFKDGVLRAVLRNAGYLGSTKLIGAVLGLGALICAGRGMTTAEFGTLMLIHTYALGAGALTKFQSWQMILRYGAPALQRGDWKLPEAAIRFGFGLDIASGTIGMTLAMIVLPFFGHWFGITQNHTLIALAYCTLIPTMSCATPTGVLRLMDRFDLIAGQQIVTPLLRAVGAVVSWAFSLGCPFFVLSWYIADIMGDMILWVLTAQELRQHKMLKALRPSLIEAPAKLPGVWNFVWLTNLNTTLDACWSPVGNLIVGGMLGPSAAGLYKISSTLLDSAVKPARMLEKGFYPEIMRLDPSSRQPWQLALRTGLLSGAIGLGVVLVILIGGQPFIGLFGPRYAAAATLMAIMSPALVISMTGFPLESLLYMAGRPKAVLIAQVISVTLYMGTLVIMAQTFGLYGAGIAYVAGTFLLTLLSLIPTILSYVRRQHIVSPTIATAKGVPSSSGN
ncbi:lipopolysaccharide biosynthesis protein [Gluconobacter wancherniae]|uniref:lipopolysaccharide biosynthesis protein n=1 Tax=Gluconobacter wancherniae TaxID=1307955 RepID=UPI0030AA6052